MSDMLADGMKWLAGQLRQGAATPVRYARGDRSAVVPATLGKKLLKLDDLDGGIRYEHTDLDLIVAAADLTPGGEAVEPERGDRAYVTRADGTTDVYEAFPYGGEPVFQWCDPHRQMMRIHMKFVESEGVA